MIIRYLLDFEGNFDAWYTKQADADRVVRGCHAADCGELRNCPAGSRFHGRPLVGHAERSRSRRLPNSE